MEAYISNIRKRFLKDTKEHQLTIVKDDGIYRHIQISKPGTCVCHYNLTTWPYHLCISGDMGTWVFSRIEDMFDFFIMNDSDYNKPDEINPHYWAEKVQAISRFGGSGIYEFDTDDFKAQVRRRVKEYFEGHPQGCKECLQELEDDVFMYMDDYPKEVIYERLYNFSYSAPDGDEFTFSGEDMPDAQRFSLYYIWILYAIVKGITMYNKYHANKH